MNVGRKSLNTETSVGFEDGMFNLARVMESLFSKHGCEVAYIHELALKVLMQNLSLMD